MGYENTAMQYTAIFTAVKNDKFQLKKCEAVLMSTYIKVGGCKGSTLHGHVCMIGIFELMVNLSTGNALHCIHYVNISVSIKPYP